MTSLTGQVVEIVAEDDLGVMFVTSMSFVVEGLWLPILGGGGEALGFFVFPVPLILMNSCGLSSNSVGRVGTICKILELSEDSWFSVKGVSHSVENIGGVSRDSGKTTSFQESSDLVGKASSSYC